MKLSLKIDMPEQLPQVRPMTRVEKAQKLINKVENSWEDSQTEWEVLVQSFKKLKCIKNRTGEMKQLYDMIFPVIDKYSRNDVNHGDVLETNDYLKYMDQKEEDTYEQD